MQVVVAPRKKGAILKELPRIRSAVVDLYHTLVPLPRLLVLEMTCTRPAGAWSFDLAKTLQPNSLCLGK